MNFYFSSFQLSPIERYAMRFVEETGGLWTEQLRFAEAEIEQQKREWEANRLAALRKEEEDAKRAEEEENQLLTYSGVDARNQVNNRSKNTVNRSLSRNRNLTRRRSEIVKANRRSRNLTPKSPQSKRRTILTTTSPKKRKVEENKPTKSRTISRNIPKRSCRQTNNSRSEATDNDMDVSSDGCNASSTEQKGTSDSFIDSECSLDVMYDSIDEQQSESNSVQASSSTCVDNEKSESSDGATSENEENGSEEQNGNETLAKPLSAEKRRVSLTNQLDINSPRTRSRGTVKLNLFALDDCPMLPTFGARSKNKQPKAQSNDLNDKNTSDVLSRVNNSRSRSVSSSESSQKLKKDDSSIVRVKRSRSKSQSNDRRSRSKSLSNDIDKVTTHDSRSKFKKDDVRSKRSRSNSEVNDQSHSNDIEKMTADDSHNAITVIKLAQIKDGLDGSKPIKPKRSSTKKVVVKNGKSSSTLDSWLSSSKSPKIVLHKADDAIAKHLTQMESRTRRSSTLKINSENGPS